MPGSLFAAGLEVKINKKTQEKKAAVGAGAGSIGKGFEVVSYQVDVQNKDFQAKPVLKARYILFVERQRVGQKIGDELVEKVKGEASVPELAAMKSAQFATEGVKLLEERLTGAYIYADGGRIKAKDSLLGIWVKFFDGDTEVGEYVNPTSLKGRHQWE